MRGTGVREGGGQCEGYRGGDGGNVRGTGVGMGAM